MTFPSPENTFSAETLAHMAARRERFQRSCPQHEGQELEFWKELLVGDGTGEYHMPTTAIYACGCLISVRLDTNDEPTLTPQKGDLL